MKQLKITLALLLVSLLSYTWMMYALWKWRLWVDNISTATRFTDVWAIWGINAYKDTFTWLYWEKTPAWGTRNWQSALDYCPTIWDGSWRLPDKNEMFSIMVNTVAERNWSNRYTALHSITDNRYWSSTSAATNANSAWNGDFNYGYVPNNTKTSNFSTICIHD